MSFLRRQESLNYKRNVTPSARLNGTRQAVEGSYIQNTLMKIENTPLKDCYLISPTIFKDERGLFYESFNQERFNEKIGAINFVQDNISESKRGVLRGLHFQQGKSSQAKLITVIKGEVQDLVVDMRKESETFGQHFSMILNNKKRQQLFIPKGFAHGFLTLSDEAIFSYKCDTFYKKTSETGIVFNDSDLDIEWAMPLYEMILSEKDRMLPTFKDFLK